MPKPKPKMRPQPAEVVQQQTATAKQEKKAEVNTPEIEDISDVFTKKEEKLEVIKSIDPVKEDVKASGVKEITVETDLFIAVFTNEGAGLKSFILKKYKDDKKNPLDLISEKARDMKPLPFQFSTVNEDEMFKQLNKETFAYNGELNVQVSGKETKEVAFRFADVAANLKVTKTFIFSNSYIIGIECEVIKEGALIPAPIVFGPDLENNIKPERLSTNLKIGAFDGNDMRSVNFEKIKTTPTANPAYEKAYNSMEGFFNWAAYERSYFAAIFKSSRRDAPIKYSIIKKKIDEKKSELYSYIIVTDPEKVYLGPKDEEILASVENVFLEANKTIEYGWLGSIAKILLKGVNFIHGYVPNYGWALVIFTIFLKILLFPLTYKSSVSMAKMQTLQPKIKAIKKKYKNLKDPEQRKQMNVETMALYKTEKVNPMGGCLPMLLQMPILFGFFNLLRSSINVRHEAWIFWITDLSLKDPIYLLPILMGVSQIIVQKMSPSSGDPTQKKMMYLMPVVITFFVMSLPSGLTLYWFVSNLLQIGQQQIINKKIYQEKKEEEKERKVQKRKKRKG
jgi:YidC/Oxa1 family membrane protein insertase